MVTSNTYLMQAGPLGSCLGVILGAVVMLIIAWNYHYMMNCYPETGGSYAFVRNAMGFDQGFLIAWFVIITYLAMLWANASSLPLFARYFMGDTFEFGYMYNIFGYDVYFGEALLSIGTLVIIAFLCSRHKRLTSLAMIALATVFSVGITVCFLVSLVRNRTPVEPQVIPDKDILPQVFRIAVISPWAFIGFENISHAAEEFHFDQKRSFEVLSVAVVTAALLYIFVILLSVSAYPPEYANWLEYIRDLPNLSGIKGLPPFYAAHRYFGMAGVWTLLAALLALIITSLIGNIFALSRLFYALSQDDLVSKKFAEVNERGTPEKAIIFIVCVSAVIPFIGRTAIGWIVDVTTLGATMIYAFVSSATVKIAMTRDDTMEKYTGVAGVATMLIFMVYVLGMSVFTTNYAIDKAALFLFAVWAVLGILYFRVLLKNDKKNRFGKSLSVWVALLSHLMLISLVWVSQMIMDETHQAMINIQQHYINAGYGADQSWFIEEALESIRNINALSVVVVVIIFASAVGILLTSYTLMRKRANQSEEELSAMQEMANTDPLTGVRSKHAYAQMEKAVDDAINAGTVPNFAVVVCDVNGLKFVNDTLGHKAGDAYIKSASEMISGIFKHSTIYRTGGDEFVVLLRGRDYKHRAELLHQLHDTSVAHIAEGSVVVSGGSSDYVPKQDHDIHDVFVRADALMYEEKMSLKGMGAKTRE